MENKSKLRTVLSWADEVEQEEQQAAAATQVIEQCNQKTPNPFGSAKTREVVLQERGIDCTSFHQHLNNSSSIRNEHGDKQELKENLYVPATPTMGKRQQTPSTRTLEQKNRDNKTGLLKSSHSHDISSVLVPPLRYPPKNYINGVYIPAYNMHSPLPLAIRPQNFQYPNHPDDPNRKALQEPTLPGFHHVGLNQNKHPRIQKKPMETPKGSSRGKSQSKRQNIFQLSNSKTGDGDLRGNRTSTMNKQFDTRARSAQWRCQHPNSKENSIETRKW